ncbi:unnamed protein product [Trichobilharzia szidati]|nr:unnamed protein product [Trichobilharzia szidati]
MSSSNGGCRGYVGTTGYMAPEILEYLGEQTYTTKVDIYALGILICEMIQLEQPYKKSSSMLYRLTQEVISGVRPEIPLHFIKRCPSALIDLMTYCWASDPNRRPTAEQIVQLTNPWWLSSDRTMLSMMNKNDKKKFDIDHTSPVKKSMNEQKFGGNTTVHSSTFTANTALNSFSYIQSVNCIDALDVITCALVDEYYNLWLGGYSKSPLSSSSSSSNDSNDATQSIHQLGLLFIISLTLDDATASSSSCCLLSSWPTVPVIKQYSQGFIKYETISKVIDWPIHLCALNNNNNTRNRDSHLMSSNEDIGHPDRLTMFVACLTYLGELRIYRPQYKTMEYICLLKIQLSEEYTKPDISTPVNKESGSHFQSVKCMLAYLTSNFHPLHFSYHRHLSSLSPASTSSTSTPPTPLPPVSSIGCIHFILCLSVPKICIISVNILSPPLVLKCMNTVCISVDQPVYTGVILPEICGYDVWFSQNGGKLMCYTWDNALHETGYSPSSSFPSSLSSCLKYRSSWSVPSSSDSRSSCLLVTHFLLENSSQVVVSNKGRLAQNNRRQYEEEGVYVWTYLRPDGRLDCWSVATQNLMKSINLAGYINQPGTQEVSMSEMFGSVRAMEWLNSPTNVLLITTNGYLLHINVTHINTVNSHNIHNNNSSLAVASDSENSSSNLANHPSTPSPKSSSLASLSTLFDIHSLHYHGLMTDNDFVLIVPLTLKSKERLNQTSTTEAGKSSSMPYIPKRILTIAKGFLNPLLCVNPLASSVASSTSFNVNTIHTGNKYTNTSISSQTEKTIENLNQEKYYLVKLFNDKFLFS